jgi:hypothetical protein
MSLIVLKVFWIVGDIDLRFMMHNGHEEVRWVAELGRFEANLGEVALSLTR